MEYAHEAALRDALSDDGDLELRFQGGQSLPVHSQKLKLASTVLKDLITSVLDDMIAASAAKRRRTAEGSSCVIEQQELPSLLVRSSGHCIYSCLLQPPNSANAHAPCGKPG